MNPFFGQRAPAAGALGWCGVERAWDSPGFPPERTGQRAHMGDLAGFALTCIVLLWLLSRFRGWGVVFLGGLGSLALIGLLAALLLRVLYRRAVGRRG